MPVRAAELTDAMRLAQVRVASWKTAYRGLLPDSYLDKMQVTDGGDRWREMLIEEASQTLVYEQGHSVVGFVSFGKSRDDDAKDTTGEIWGIYLLPGVWRRGYGTALFGEALRLLGQQGYSDVTLWVLAGNCRAISFYEAMGFTADDTTKVVTTGEGMKLHERRYRRSIALVNDKQTDWTGQRTGSVPG